MKPIYEIIHVLHTLFVVTLSICLFTLCMVMVELTIDYRSGEYICIFFFFGSSHRSMHISFLDTNSYINDQVTFIKICAKKKACTLSRDGVSMFKLINPNIYGIKHFVRFYC